MNPEHGGNIWINARKTGLAPQNIIDFSANLNFLGPPPKVQKLLKQKVGFIRYYPEPQAQTLRLAVAQKLDLSPEQIIIGNGASELISLFFWVLRPETVFIPIPTYSDYTRAARSAGCKIINFHLTPERQAFSLNLIADEINRHHPKAFVLCNPNNPTGTFWNDVTPLLEASAANDSSLLLDVSFLPFADAKWVSWIKQNAFLPFWQDKGINKGNLFLVFSLTKIFALPGLRIGAGIGPPFLIRQIEAARDPWSVNSLAQLAGWQCLQEQAYLKKSFEITSQEREYLHKGLSKLPGLRPLVSQANFLLVNCLQTERKASQIAAALKRKGILIRDAGNFPGLDAFFFRLAVKKRNENYYLLRMLKKCLETSG